MILKVGPISVEEGQKGSGYLKMTELPDGSEVACPLVVVHGRKAGPKLYLGAAFHGDEANGVESIRRLWNELDPAELSGSVIAVPVQNPLAFHAGNRLPVNQLVRSPLDCAPADMHSMFPGSPSGNPFEQMVHLLFSQVVSRADYAVDLHQPTTGGAYVPIAFVPLAGGVEGVARSEGLARAFGTDFVVKTARGGYAREGNLHVYAALSGIPSIMVELGEGGRLEGPLVDLGVEGIKNVMRHLGMIEGGPARREQTAITEMVEVRASRGGLLLHRGECGRRFSKGELVAEIAHPLGPVVEAVRSPVDGVLLRKTTFSTIIPGERVAVFGV